MKVLFVTNMYPVPDYIYFGIHVKEQIDALRGLHNIESDVYFIDGRSKKSNYFKSIDGIRMKLNENRYDLIHIHYGISGLFLLFFKPSIPVVITLHSGELFGKKGFINSTVQRLLTLSIIKRTQKIIVLNDQTIELLQEHGAKLLKQPCGTDINFFKEDPKPYATKKFVIGFPGNKQRNEKNFTLFKEIVDTLSNDIDIEIFEFHNITRTEVLENLNRMDILLMTSTKEGSPQIIKEAMACNKPIVSTNVGDVIDLLKDVDNCHVINSFNAIDFIDPVRKIYSLASRDRISNGRKKLIKMGLDSSSVANRIYKLYQDVL